MVAQYALTAETFDSASSALCQLNHISNTQRNGFDVEPQETIFLSSTSNDNVTLTKPRVNFESPITEIKLADPLP